MGETEISWTHKPGTVGRTWNPVQGCRRVSPGCEHCYAERLAARFAESGWSNGLINIKTRKWNGEARLAAHKLSEPLQWRKPSTVFVNSMSDLFYEGFSNEQIAAVFGVMAAAPQHTFQILTKRAKRMREWFEWAGRFTLDDLENQARLFVGEDRDYIKRGHTWPLPNLWLGVSVENHEAAATRIPELLRTPAAVRFLSCEPLLGSVDLAAASPNARSLVEDLDWVIAGCESGPRARACDADWLRSLRDQCKAAGVPYFLKQAIPREGQSTITDIRPVPQVLGRIGVLIPVVGVGPLSKEKGRGVIELPYLDGVQHKDFPNVDG